MKFGSDNQSGASLKVLEMIKVANEDYTHSYGDDEWTKQAIDELKKIFECDLEAYFVSTGTASNSLALSCIVQPWETILCHNYAHILIEESTAPEYFSGGAHMKPISQWADKVTTEYLKNYFEITGTDLPHNSPARALSITQASELGLVYSPAEVKALSTISKDNGLRIHMDGARFANALASLECTPADLTWKSGVDVLSLGATKCGALCAEAVIFFDKELSGTFIHRSKRSGHLLSKGRILGAQFVGWLRDNHWLELARHANSQAAQLSEMISSIEGLQLVWPVQANELFVTMPKTLAKYLREAGAEFYEWYLGALSTNIEIGDDDVLVRLVTSFRTKDEQRIEFCELIHQYFSES
ncbi:MAG: low specificity L-threonine aldolase [Deltaproteobacteria bacterium]|nr:low specificity L-threonine aldolase [Deltaproteobacteria bacterium]